MKKYFMKNTEDELQFGDMIELDFTKDMPDGNVKHKHLECKFLPELIPMLLEEDIIEVVDDEEEPTEETPEDCCPIEQIIIAQEDLELKVEKLEKIVKELYAIVKKSSKEHAKQAV